MFTPPAQESFHEDLASPTDAPGFYGTRSFGRGAPNAETNLFCHILGLQVYKGHSDLAQEGHMAVCVSSAFLNRVLLRPLAKVQNNMLVKVHHISMEKQDTYVTETYWIF